MAEQAEKIFIQRSALRRVEMNNGDIMKQLNRTFDLKEEHKLQSPNTTKTKNKKSSYLRNNAQLLNKNKPSTP